MKRSNVLPKTAKTIKDYPVKNYKDEGVGGYDFVVPAGSIVTNVTACGPDDGYRFWQDFHGKTEALVGWKCPCLDHDLTYYGLNIPKEYCEPYPCT